MRQPGIFLVKTTNHFYSLHENVSGFHLITRVCREISLNILSGKPCFCGIGRYGVRQTAEQQHLHHRQEERGRPRHAVPVAQTHQRDLDPR